MDSLLDLMDTPGGAALVTAVATIASLSLGLFLQPWVQRRVREQERSEQEKAHWTRQGREISAELQSILWGLAFDQTSEAARRAAVQFLSDVEGPLIRLSFFAVPEDPLRTAANDAWQAFRDVSNLTLSAHRESSRPDGDLDVRLKLGEKRKVARTEARATLDRLVVALRD